MKYSNQKIPEGINYSKENPLKEFFLLSVSVSLFLLFFVLAVYFLAQSFAHHIPFSLEAKLVSESTQQGLFNNSDRANTSEHLKKQTYIANLAQSLGQKMALPEDIKLNVYYSESSTVNAFASLNGMIVINQGLIDFVESENELAFIIAHEIAHIKERHPIKSLSSGLIVQIALSAILGSDLGPTATGLSNAAMLGALNFSRKNELSADALALGAVQGHYGHLGASVDFFSRLQEQQESPELLSFISTHPGNQHRIKQIFQLSEQDEFLLSEDFALTPLPEFMRPDSQAHVSEAKDATESQ